MSNVHMEIQMIFKIVLDMQMITISHSVNYVAIQLKISIDLH